MCGVGGEEELCDPEVENETSPQDSHSESFQLLPSYYQAIEFRRPWTPGPGRAAGT